jgi:CDP-glycerol glycerophosphotransferase (TagB/SpsB family)
MKTIFITSCHALISRNILSSGLLEMLSKESVRIVVIVPKNKIDTFVRNFATETVYIEGVEIKSKRREMFMRYLSLAALNTTTLNIKRKTEMKGSGKIIKYFVSNAIAHYLIRFIEKITYKDEIFKDLFEKYKPSLVFSTDIQNEIDIALMNEAKKAGIYSISKVRSWDNLTSKGLIRVVTDKLLMWNDIIKEEATRINQINPKIIETIGIPHYDAYSRYEYLEKTEFLKKIGGDPSKKLITVIPIGDRYLKNNNVDKDVVYILDQVLPKDYEILVRMPPGDYVRQLESNPDQFGRKVLYDRAESTAENVKLTEMVKGDDEHYANILHHSEIVVSGPSTAVLDAAYLDRPIVLFGFDGHKNTDFLDSIIRYYKYDNFQPVINSGGVVLSKTQDEFKNHIKEYLKNPSKDKEGRKKLAEMEAKYLDGKSTERLFRVLIEEIKKR